MPSPNLTLRDIRRILSHMLGAIIRDDAPTFAVPKDLLIEMLDCVERTMEHLGMTPNAE